MTPRIVTTPRFCACGAPLSQYARKELCVSCRERAAKERYLSNPEKKAKKQQRDHARYETIKQGKKQSQAPTFCKWCHAELDGKKQYCGEACKKKMYRSKLTAEDLEASRAAARERMAANYQKTERRCLHCGKICSRKFCCKAHQKRYNYEHSAGYVAAHSEKRTARSQRRREQAERKAQREAAGNNAKPLPRYGGTNKAGPQMGSERIIPGVIRVVRDAYSMADEFERAALRQRNPDIDFESEKTNG